MQDVSATGMSVTIHSTVTIPVPTPITHFADDQQPIETDPQEVTGYGMGVNGDLVTHTKPAPCVVKLSIIPGTADDLLLYTLLRMNSAGSLVHAYDVVDMTVVYPNVSKPQRYQNGKIVSGPIGETVSTEGKKSGKQYTFVFEKCVV